MINRLFRFSGKKQTLLELLKESGVIKSSKYVESHLTAGTVNVRFEEGYNDTITVHEALQTLVDHLDLGFKIDESKTSGHTIVNKKPKGSK